MSVGDMELKRRIGLQKIRNAIRLHNGTTIMSAGITAMVPGITTAAAEAAGVRIFEISQNGVALNQGLHGATNRHDVRRVSYQLPMEDMAKHVRGTRNVVSDDVFIAVGAPGIWTQTSPTPFLEEHALLLSYSGADGLDVHKASIEDYRTIGELAHKYGMLMAAYILPKQDVLDIFSSPYFAGIEAETPKHVEKVTKDLEAVGADMVGLVTGKTYAGLKATQVSKQEEERILAMVGAATVPTLVQGGITPDNAAGYKRLGAQILVVGTVFDDLVRVAIKDCVDKILA